MTPSPPVDLQSRPNLPGLLQATERPTTSPGASHALASLVLSCLAQTTALSDRTAASQKQLEGLISKGQEDDDRPRLKEAI